jgi:hypothetical protein
MASDCSSRDCSARAVLPAADVMELPNSLSVRLPCRSLAVMLGALARRGPPRLAAATAARDLAIHWCHMALKLWGWGVGGRGWLCEWCEV